MGNIILTKDFYRLNIAPSIYFHIGNKANERTAKNKTDIEAEKD
jgi:hypothetical protein